MKHGLLVFGWCFISGMMMAQAHAVDKDSTDYGIFYTDERLNVFVFMGFPTDDEQEIFLQDLRLGLGDGIDSTYYLVRFFTEGVTDGEVYCVKQFAKILEGDRIPTVVAIDIGTKCSLVDISLWSDAFRPGPRSRTINVDIAVAER